jgi:hypothetical protein
MESYTRDGETVSPQLYNRVHVNKIHIPNRAILNHFRFMIFQTWGGITNTLEFLSDEIRWPPRGGSHLQSLEAYKYPNFSYGISNLQLHSQLITQRH